MFVCVFYVLGYANLCECIDVCIMHYLNVPLPMQVMYYSTLDVQAWLFVRALVNVSVSFSFRASHES